MVDSVLAVRLRSGQGLGNQLFTVISGFGLATKRGVPLEIAGIDSYKLQRLKLRFNEAFLSKCRHQYISMDLPVGYDSIVYERVGYMREGSSYRLNSEFDVGLLHTRGRCLVEGHLQSKQYWDIPELRPENIFLNPDSVFERECTPPDTAVINIRGGEYVGNSFLLPAEFWEFGMELLHHDGYRKFLIVSDDRYYVESLLNTSRMRSFGEARIFDGDLLSHVGIIATAKTILISNSTFPVPLLRIFNKDAVVYAPNYWTGYNQSIWSPCFSVVDDFLYIDHRLRSVTLGSTIEVSSLDASNEDPRALGIGVLPSRGRLIIDSLARLKRRFTTSLLARITKFGFRIGRPKR